MGDAKHPYEDLQQFATQCDGKAYFYWLWHISRFVRNSLQTRLGIPKRVLNEAELAALVNHLDMARRSTKKRHIVMLLLLPLPKELVGESV